MPGLPLQLRFTPFTRCWMTSFWKQQRGFPPEGSRIVCAMEALVRKKAMIEASEWPRRSPERCGGGGRLLGAVPRRRARSRFAPACARDFLAGQDPTGGRRRRKRRVEGTDHL